MKIEDLVVSPEAVPAFEPPGHTATVNRRLVPPPGCPTGTMEVVLGVLPLGAQALMHSHEDLDQAQYLLEGRCLVESEGRSVEMRAGQIVYFPKGVPHKITCIGEAPARWLVFYAPPLHK